MTHRQSLKDRVIDVFYEPSSVHLARYRGMDGITRLKIRTCKLVATSLEVITL